MGVRSEDRAESQARFVYVREEGDFIGAAAPPPRLAPPRPPGPCSLRGHTPCPRSSPCPSSRSRPRAYLSSSSARQSHRLLRKPL